MKWRDNPDMARALDLIFDTLSGESGGGGVTFEPVEPQGIAVIDPPLDSRKICGLAFFFDDGRAAFLNLGGAGA